MIMSLVPHYLILCALAGGQALFAQESQTPGAPYPSADGRKTRLRPVGRPGTVPATSTWGRSRKGCTLSRPSHSETITERPTGG